MSQFWPPLAAAVLGALFATILTHALTRRRDWKLAKRQRLLDSSAATLTAIHEFVEAYSDIATLDGSYRRRVNLKPSDQRAKRNAFQRAYQDLATAYARYQTREAISRLYATRETTELMDSIAAKIDQHKTYVEHLETKYVNFPGTLATLEQQRDAYQKHLKDLAR